MESTRSKPHNYHAYLLRIWLAQGVGQDVGWQASLQDAIGHRRIGFASLEELFAFLMNEIENNPERGELEPDTDEHAGAS